jgi:hypothetical protein
VRGFRVCHKAWDKQFTNKAALKFVYSAGGKTTPQSQGDLSGKVALIRRHFGICRDTAVLFAKQGAKVAITGRREIEGAETVSLIRRRR